MSKINLLSYKELQTFAKQCNIPANMQRKFLVQALVAHQSNDPGLVDTIVNSYRAQRRRRMMNKPQNLTTSKRKRKNQQKDTWPNKDGSIVDSTSSDTKELVHVDFVSTYRSASNGGFADSSVNSTPSDRYRYFSRLYPGQQLQFMTDIPPLNAANLSDNRFNAPFAYDYQMNVKNPPNVLPPYNSSAMSKFPLYQDVQQNYSPADAASSSYYNNSGMCRSPSYPPLPNLTSYDNYNASNSHLVSQNYSQVSVGAGFESSSLVISNNSQDEQLRLCAMSKNSYYSKNESSNKPPSIEVNSVSHLLPNIPQLNGSTESDLSDTASWSQTSTAPHNSGRIKTQLDPPNNNVSFCEISEPKEENTGITNATSVSAEFDSNSEEGTLSLSDEIASLFEIDRSMSNSSKVHPQLPSYPSESYLEPVQPNYNGYQENGGMLSGAYNQYQDNCNSSCGGTLNTVGTSVAVPTSVCCSFSDTTSSAQSCNQLPPVFTLFSDFGQMSAAGAHTGQQNLPTMYRSPTASSDGTYAAYGSLNKAEETDASSLDRNCIDLTSSEKSLACCNSRGNLLRNRLQQIEARSSSGAMSVYSNENQQPIVVSKPEQNAGVRPPNVSTREKPKNSVSVPHKISQLKLKTSIRDNKNAVANTGGKMVIEKFQNNNEGIVNVKSENGRLVYESETLHRSKIICEIPNDSGLKEENIRKFVQIFMPQDQCPEPLPIPRSKPELSLEPKLSEAGLATIPLCRPCANKKRGCGNVVMIEYPEIHEKQCVFQSAFCPSESCSWLDTLHLLARHISEFHRTELVNRNEYVYMVDRTDCKDRSFHTFFQVHNDTIYVIRLHINDEKCVAVAQYIPEAESTTLKKKEVCGGMQLMCFSNKPRMKTWKGQIQPYHENDHQVQDQGVLQVNVRDSVFLVLRFFVN